MGGGATPQEDCSELGLQPLRGVHPGPRTPTALGQGDLDQSSPCHPPPGLGPAWGPESRTDTPTLKQGRQNHVSPRGGAARMDSPSPGLHTRPDSLPRAPSGLEALFDGSRDKWVNGLQAWTTEAGEGRFWVGEVLEGLRGVGGRGRCLQRGPRKRDRRSAGGGAGGGAGVAWAPAPPQTPGSGRQPTRFRCVQLLHQMGPFRP